MAETLASAIDKISDEVLARIEAEVIVDGLLEGIATVQLGQRSRPRPDLPAVFVYFGTARNLHRQGALREQWSLPLTAVVLVSSDEPEDGYRECMDYVTKVRSVLLEDRHIALDFVRDVKSVSFDPAYRTEVDNRLIYGAAATVAIEFTVFEITS